MFIHSASTYNAPPEPYPNSQRLPARCEAFPVLSGQFTDLHWRGNIRVGKEEKAWLRVTMATDVREIVRVAAVGTRTGRPVAAFDLRFSHVFQVHEASLSTAALEVLFDEGLSLRTVEGENPAWFFWEGPGAEAFRPHILIAPRVAGTEEAALSRVSSLDSLQPFGWLEGCVLDGLLALHRRHPDNPLYREGLRRHLSAFAGESGDLVYENPRNGPSDGVVYGEEGPLPFAILAIFQPDSPWLEVAERFFEVWTIPLREGIQKQRNVGETSYTCAYPLAALEKAKPGREWDRMAALHLLNQRDVLADDDGLWLRRSHDGTQVEYRNWARAHAWYLLGLARTLPLIAHLPDAVELREEFRRACAWTEARQRKDGLWSVFVDQPELTADTSGTAGIATSFSIGVNEGWLDDRFRRAALRTRRALAEYLTSDGFLRGVAQGNKGGDSLQRGRLRVMAQFGLGLYAQLVAESGPGHGV